MNLVVCWKEEKQAYYSVPNLHVGTGVIIIGIKRT